MTTTPTNAERLRRVAVPLVLLLAMIGVLVASFGYDAQARALPVLVAASTIVLLLVEVLVQAGTRAGRRIEALLEGRDFFPVPERAPPAKALVHAFVWPGALIVLTIVLGMLPAVLIYVFLSLKIVARKSAPHAAATALAVTTACWALFEWGMSYELYRGLLWPLL